MDAAHRIQVGRARRALEQRAAAIHPGPLAGGGGWLVLRWSGGIVSAYAAQAVALVLYGLINGAAVTGGAWFGPLRRPRRPASWAGAPRQA